MTQELSKDLINDLNRQFEAGLAKVKYEYQKNLQEADPLDRDALEKMLTVFNQRLVIFQHEFMDYLSKVRDGGVNPDTEEFVVEAPPIDRIPEIASSIIAGGGGAILVALIPVGTAGWWIWATTLTTAASIGSAVGAPAGIVTAGGGRRGSRCGSRCRYQYEEVSAQARSQGSYSQIRRGYCSKASYFGS